MKGMGKAIRRYREEAGITQERLAELVDISTNHLGAIEREVKTPTMETFVNMWWLRFWQFVTVEAKPVVSCQLRKQIHSWGCWERICPKL